MTRSGNTTVPSEHEPLTHAPRAPQILPALVIIWSAQEPHRCGEIAFLGTNASWWLGRGIDEASRLHFFQQRPAEMEETRGLIGDSISRQQASIVVNSDGITIENVGNAKLVVNGISTSKALLTLDDIIEIRGHYAFMLIERPTDMPRSPHLMRWSHAFAEPDEHGILGESVAAWQLRADLAAAAQSIPHVLVLGESGTGKELAARAIHARSPRAKGPFIARSAATFTAGLIEAELFGNAKNFPNPGMPAHEGFVGAAHGGTLFLDEIGELPHEMQAPLLRVLDGDGEYHRLGETKLRHADVRLIGATNREYASLKHDFAARLAVCVKLPPLSARREDIPLLARRLVLAAAKKSPGVAGRFVDQGDYRADIRIDAALITYLARRPYSTHVRELDALLWEAMNAANGTTLRLTEAIASSHLARAKKTGASHSADEAPANGSFTREQLIEALEKNRWRQVDAANALGITRHTIARLIRKHGLHE